MTNELLGIIGGLLAIISWRVIGICLALERIAAALEKREEK